MVGLLFLCCSSYHTVIYPLSTGTISGKTDEKDGIFEVDKLKSYRCKKTKKFSMKSDLDIELRLSNFQAQAFEFDKNPGDFDKG